MEISCDQSFPSPDRELGTRVKVVDEEVVRIVQKISILMSSTGNYFSPSLGPVSFCSVPPGEKRCGGTGLNGWIEGRSGRRTEWREEVRTGRSPSPFSQPKHPDRVLHDRAGPRIDCIVINACKSVRLNDTYGDAKSPTIGQWLSLHSLSFALSSFT